MSTQGESYGSAASSWSMHDRGPVPEVVEDASEAAWREFQACCEALNACSAPLRTVPQAVVLLARRASALRATDRDAAQGMAEERPVPARPAAPKPVPATPAHLPAPDLSVDGVMALARERHRVCPTARAWQRLHALLSRLEHPDTPHLPEPVGPDDWARSTDLQKRLRLREQLAWAQRLGALPGVRAFLKSLDEDQWHHHTPPGWPALTTRG